VTWGSNLCQILCCEPSFVKKSKIGMETLVTLPHKIAVKIAGAS
jgi:hypothetical protein